MKYERLEQTVNHVALALPESVKSALATGTIRVPRRRRLAASDLEAVR